MLKLVIGSSKEPCLSKRKSQCTIAQSTVRVYLPPLLLLQKTTLSTDPKLLPLPLLQILSQPWSMSAPIPRCKNKLPRDYAEPTWTGFKDTIDRNTTSVNQMKQYKKQIETIAAIADQVRWTTSQMRPEYLPKTKTVAGTQFLQSSLLQLETVCYEPLMAIRQHIINVRPELFEMVCYQTPLTRTEQMEADTNTEVLKDELADATRG